MLPHSPSCDRNKGPILEIIRKIFTSGTVLEIGSGSAQHAEYFSNQLNVQWQTSDQAQYHQGILLRKTTNNCRYLGPIEIKVGNDHGITEEYDGVFSANTLHIMDEEHAYSFAEFVSPLIKEKGDLVVYGPFVFDTKTLAQSNKDFDLNLKSRNPKMGLRSFEKLDKLFEGNGLKLDKVYAMPANNHLLHYRKC